MRIATSQRTAPAFPTLRVQLDKMVVHMTLLNDSLPVGRSTGRQTPRDRPEQHLASVVAHKVDVTRRVPADMSKAIHKFMQIDENAFHRALLRVNQDKHAARPVHFSGA